MLKHELIMVSSQNHDSNVVNDAQSEHSEDSNASVGVETTRHGRKPELVIVGTMALDSVETPFGKVKNALGGSATYASLAATYFTKPGVVSIIGNDFPESHLKMLQKQGIDLAGVEKHGKTFRWSGSYEFAMNEAKTHKTELNSLLEFKPVLSNEYKQAHSVFLANVDPSIQLEVLDQLKPGTFVLLDTMNFWIETKRNLLLEVIKKVSVLLLNEGEARQLMNTPNLIKAGHELLDIGPEYIIIKKGEHGAIVFSPHGFFSAPGYPLEEVRDPTGAGDSFAGGLIGYLAHTGDVSFASVKKGVIYGSAIASFCAEHFSTAYHARTAMRDVEERYQTFRRIREF